MRLLPSALSDRFSVLKERLASRVSISPAIVAMVVGGALAVGGAVVVTSNVSSERAEGGGGLRDQLSSWSARMQGEEEPAPAPEPEPEPEPEVEPVVEEPEVVTVVVGRAPGPTAGIRYVKVADRSTCTSTLNGTIGQTPAPGTRVREGSSVSWWYWRYDAAACGGTTTGGGGGGGGGGGPTYVTVGVAPGPTSGLTYTRSAALDVSTCNEPLIGTLTTQSPTAGTSVVTGTTVSYGLYVLGTCGRVVSATGDGVVDGVTYVQGSVTYSCGGTYGITGQSIAPGTLVDAGTTVTYDVTLEGQAEGVPCEPAPVGGAATPGGELVAVLPEGSGATVS